MARAAGAEHSGTKTIANLERGFSMDRGGLQPQSLEFPDYLKLYPLLLGISQKRLADHIGCDLKVINRIVNGKAQVTPRIAIKLGAAFGTSPEFWLNSLKAVDIYKASRTIVLLLRSRLSSEMRIACERH